MDVYMDIRSMIGNTPILRLQNFETKKGVRLYAKLELANPAGSVKDRVGMYMIDDAKRRGLLKEGSTIVDATAGNTGIGIAIAALNQGYRVIFTVPDKFSQEKQKVLRALGAEIVNTPRKEGMLGAEREAERIIATIPGAISLKQFDMGTGPKRFLAQRAHSRTSCLSLMPKLITLPLLSPCALSSIRSTLKPLSSSHSDPPEKSLNAVLL